MITIRRAAERGRADFGWLDSRHTFSFGNYYDPRHMGFGPLRVINEDRVAGGGGFPAHGHADMEILSVVVSGGLAHKDSIGTGSVIRPGDVQIMSAGTGIRHSEFNASQTEPVHFLQIWIQPDRKGIAPRYDQKTFGDAALADRLALIGSKGGRDGSIHIQQDVDLYRGKLAQGAQVRHAAALGRKLWLQVIAGDVDVEGRTLSAGDGVAIEGVTALDLAARSPVDVLLFDMAA